MVKLVATDLDGTLLGTDKVIPAEMVDRKKRRSIRADKDGSKDIKND